MTNTAGMVPASSAKMTRCGRTVSERLPLRSTAVNFSGMFCCLASRPSVWPRKFSRIVFTNLKSPGQDDLQAIVTFLGQKVPCSIHVLPQDGHLHFKLLDPVLGFFLDFLEQGRLHRLGLFSNQFPGDLRQFLLTAAVLQF